MRFIKQTIKEGNMLNKLLEILICVECRDETLHYHCFEGADNTGVVVCSKCKRWFPVEDGVLEFLPKELAYIEDRDKFYSSNLEQFEKLGLSNESNPEEALKEAQSKQQQHFDWYAENDIQSYTSYERTPFWKGVDRIFFDKQNKMIAKSEDSQRIMVEVGCAQGRASYQIKDHKNLDIFAFDISKSLVKQAVERQREESKSSTDKRCFFVSDATRIPFKTKSADFVMIYGVLHHLTGLQQVCSDIVRILKPGGIFFGSENSSTIFRSIFDLLQKICPAWYDEPGDESLISDEMLSGWFKGETVKTNTTVFLPPHLVNLFSDETAFKLIRFTDSLFSKIPFLKDNGGLIEIYLRKKD